MNTSPGPPMIETPTVPAFGPLEVSAFPTWWPEWAPREPSEFSTWVSALIGLVLVGLIVRHLVQTFKPTLPGGRVETKKADDKKKDGYNRGMMLGILILAPLLLATTFYGSFHAVQELASDHHVDPAWIPPVAIDGILLLFMLVDLYQAKNTGTVNPFVKNTVRGFIAFTLVANAISGWEHGIVAILLHIPAPLGIVVITEVARIALAKEHNKKAGQGHFDPIPFMRWVLDPGGSARIFRLRILQNIFSYTEALRLENMRSDAKAIVKAMTPTQRSQIPGYLLRRLRVGVDLETTVRKIHRLSWTIMAGHYLPVHPTATKVSSSASSRPPELDNRLDEEPGRLDTEPDERLDKNAATPEQDPATPTESSPTEDVQTTSNWPSSSELDTPLDEEPGRLDERLDHPTESASTKETPDAASSPIDGDSEAVQPNLRREEAPAREAEDVQLDTDWTPEDVHTDDEDPDDDGPRGGGAPAPEPAPILPAPSPEPQMDPTPSPASELERVRIQMGGPTWAEALNGTQKEKLFALLWECAGDTEMVGEVYRRRTGKDKVPGELYRQNPKNRRDLGRSYAWAWHRALTHHLLETSNGAIQSTLLFLTSVGVNTEYGAVKEVIEEFESKLASHGVLRFPSQSRTSH